MISVFLFVSNCSNCFTNSLMFSLEAWRVRIGVWAGRVRMSSKDSAPKLNISLRQSLDILWGISTRLVAAVISVLLLVGGVELNPGPPRKDLNSSSSSEEEFEVPKCFDFCETSEGKYVFTAPITPIINLNKRMAGAAPDSEHCSGECGADEFPVGRTLNPVKPPLFSKITYIVHFLYKLCYTPINVSHYPSPMRSICDKLIF